MFLYRSLCLMSTLTSFLGKTSLKLFRKVINYCFRSLQANVKEIEHCYNNFKQLECPFMGSVLYDENHKQGSRKVKENIPNPQISSQSVTFEVDMVGFQYKVMTYRASLRQTQVSGYNVFLFSLN